MDTRVSFRASRALAPALLLGAVVLTSCGRLPLTLDVVQDDGGAAGAVQSGSAGAGGRGGRAGDSGGAAGAGGDVTVDAAAEAPGADLGPSDAGEVTVDAAGEAPADAPGDAAADAGADAADAGDATDASVAETGPAECVPLAARCASATEVQLCDGGGHWGPPAFSCANGCAAGVCRECIPGQTECTSTTTQQTCNPAGIWLAATPCAQACVNGACLP